jgi:cytidylate kinase
MAEIIGQNVIVIEGFGGSGKTTVAQKLAKRYGLSNFNTGTLFRATAAAILHEGIALEDTADFVTEAQYQMENDYSGLYVAVDGLDVSEFLQFPEITRTSSRISQIGTAALRLEKIFNESLAARNMVVEGKHVADRIGAKATYSSFFIARRSVRAERKLQQAIDGGRDYTPLEALIDIRMNDLRDKRLLTVPESAEIIDTSDITAEEVARRVAKKAALE